MVSNIAFFTKLKSLHSQKIPFIAFRLPNSEELVCYWGDGQIINNSLTEKPGFIMMPFETNKKGYFIGNDKMFSTKLSEGGFSNSLNKTLNQNLNFSAFKEVYIKDVTEIINTISKSELTKLVYSRSFEFGLSDKNFNYYLKNLLSLYTNAFCYLFYHPKENFWMGATPETLLEIQNKKITTMALAGTKKKEVARWGDKEILEQKIVVDEIKKNLIPFCKNIKAESSITVNAGKIDHLKTSISGKTSSSPSEIIASIHPTPAVGGVPKEKALSIIKSIERYDRAFYSGYLGKLSDCNCCLFVNLRCVHIQKNKGEIFVGGGITEDSNPEKEWEEIMNKSKTILDAVFK